MRDQQQHSAEPASTTNAGLVDATEFLQRFLEPFGARNVEVIGGLVEDEHVLGAGDERRQHQTPAFTAGKIADRFVLLFTGEEEGAGEVAGFLFAGAGRSLERADSAL